jgi:hypothetical protein
MTNTTQAAAFSILILSALLPPTLAKAQASTEAQPAEPPVREQQTAPPSPAGESPALVPVSPPAVAPDVPPRDSPPSPPPPTATVEKPGGIASKFNAEIYGFVEFDAIHDSTQSFNDLAGNASIARGNYAASHQRTIFGARNSRIGFKLKGPDSESIKTSAILEMDFFGNQPSPVSEAAFVTSPTFRMRHLAMKVETPIIDVLIGQYWQLFGWQSMYHPNTVEIQGVPGQIYSRSPQIRLQRMIATDDVNIELAAAAVRPSQRDSSTPDGQAGLRLILNNWKGLHTAGSTGTAIDGLSVAVSGVYRHFAVAEFTASPVAAKTKNGSGISIDALLPVVPATPTSKGNALTLNGSFVRGTGIADLYTGLSGGLTFPALPNPTGASPAPTYTANVDNGLVAFDGAGELHTINWLSYMAGLQYYLPPSGRVWISGNFSGMKSTNIDGFGGANKLFHKSYWADGNLFVDLNRAARLGAELAWFRQDYVDGTKVHNYRSQVSAFYIF